MLSRKYNKRPERGGGSNIGGNKQQQQQQQLEASDGNGVGAEASGTSSVGVRRKKNLHVSTSLPGPLTGYKRKRTQAVQAGDDSEFYNSLMKKNKANKNVNAVTSTPLKEKNSDVVDAENDDGEEEEEEEETADYDEITPSQHTLHDVTSISQQTTPIKQLPPSSPAAKAMVNNVTQQLTSASSPSRSGAEFVAKKAIAGAKFRCDSSGDEITSDSPAVRRAGSKTNKQSTTPSKTASPARTGSKSSSTRDGEPLIKAVEVTTSDKACGNSPNLAASRDAARHKKMMAQKTMSAPVRDLEKGADDDPSSGGGADPNDDNDSDAGFIDAVRGVLGGRFSALQRRGDIENVVVKFAGNLVSQIGLEKTKVEVPHQIVVEREQWDSKVDFLLSVVGFAVDLSAVWRFPAVCFSNGGGAFLLPYLIMIVICGLPLMYMEFCLGQFQRNGCITIWKNICPMFKGLGFAICIITSTIAMYYNTIMAWSLYMLLSSLTTTLPWETCNNWWNSNDSCVTVEERTKLAKHILDIVRNCSFVKNGTAPVHETSTAKFLANNEPFLLLRTDTGLTGSGGAQQQQQSADYNPGDAVTMETICNMTSSGDTTSIDFQQQVSSAEEYFYNGVLELNRSSGFSDLGAIKWQIAMCLMSIFVIVYFALWKGVKSSGKAVWFTATFPYAVLFVLLCRVMTLPGSWTGVQYYITPNLDSLYQLRVWQEAAGQVLFQLGPGFGVLLALSSYNKFHNNCLTDAIITTVISSFTSIMAGFVVFGTLGYIAGMLGKSIDQLEAFGYGLTFVAYPEAISTLPGAPIWAVLFFAMLINLGLDTTFGGMESMITGLLDYLPLKLYKRREYFVLVVILYIYFGALPTCTYGGILLVQLYDSYGVEMPLLLIAFLECVGVCWFYGIPQFSKDIAMMHGHEPSVIWKFLWCFVSPFIVLFSFVAACFREKENRYRNIIYPDWAGPLGWAVTFCSISCVPIYMVYLFLTSKGSFKERIVAMIGENAWILTVLRERRERKRAQEAGVISEQSTSEPHQHKPIFDSTADNRSPLSKVKDEESTTRATLLPGTPPPRQQRNVDKNKLATIVDMHCDCDITPGNSPHAATINKPIV